MQGNGEPMAGVFTGNGASSGIRVAAVAVAHSDGPQLYPKFRPAVGLNGMRLRLRFSRLPQFAHSSVRWREGKTLFCFSSFSGYFTNRFFLRRTRPTGTIDIISPSPQIRLARIDN